MKAPIYFPRLTIEADSVALPVSQQKKLVDVRVQQRLSMPTLCELVFLDDDVERGWPGRDRRGDERQVSDRQICNRRAYGRDSEATGRRPTPVGDDVDVLIAFTR